jgi:protein-L-isoaspartate(D-aspartate) O-methyltransferase
VELTGKERVLEIGTGSGYQTALISLLADTVYTIERVPSLSEGARAVLERAGYRNINYLVGDGTLGWKPAAPYDVILVSAASPDIPQPLVAQLAPGGRMVVPVGDRDVQSLVVVRAGPNGVETSTIGDARFVPLIGAHGWR